MTLADLLYIHTYIAIYIISNFNAAVMYGDSITLSFHFISLSFVQKGRIV